MDPVEGRRVVSFCGTLDWWSTFNKSGREVRRMFGSVYIAYLAVGKNLPGENLGKLGFGDWV